MTETDEVVDPTDVLGRRIAAHLIDAVVYLAAFLVPFLATATSTRFPVLDDSEYRVGVEDSTAFVRLGERVWFLEVTELAVVGAIGLGVFLFSEVLLQGVAGMTPGKAALGLRTIDRDGFSPGVGRGFVRTLLWVVDTLPGTFLFPVVAFISAVASKTHRRVGDFAAGTFVVRRSAAGAPIRTEVVAAPADAWSGEGTEGDTDWRADDWGDEPATADAAAAPPAVDDAGEHPVPEPAPTQDGADDHDYSPEWDAARGAYIQWDPRRAVWLQFDDAAGEWRPIDT